MLIQRITRLLSKQERDREDSESPPATPLELVVTTAVLSLIPTLCGYIATAHIGWDIGVRDAYTLPAGIAIYIAIAAFVSFNVGVYVMGFAICWLGQTFDVKPDPLRCIELAILTSAPLFLTGFVALYPVFYIDVIVGMLALAVSIYLLYVGVPIYMRVSKETGFIYSTWIASLGLIMLVVFMGLSVFIFSWLT
ncbi:MAG: Yip1 family protein [Gammaproteobacteria bacterium]|nr:Yip1 family protein [Gammaproteobacteria bacterium]